MDIIDQTNKVDNDDLLMLEQLLEFMANEENIHKESEVSLLIVTNKTIRELNDTYRNINKVTDVLSFPLGENIDRTSPLHLGDIVICLERAVEQAEEYNHSFQRELGFLTAHGFLHLLGYNHDDEISATEMFKKQKELLESFGLTRGIHD